MASLITPFWRLLLVRPVTRVVPIVLIVVAFFSSAHRLPAPIVEETASSPTPAPAHSVKPKPKRTVKPANEDSANSAKKAGTPIPTPNQNLFDGTWSGYPTGDDYRTLFISGHGNAVVEKSTKYGTYTRQPVCDGASLKWTPSWLGGSCSCIFVPNSDGKTATYSVSCSGITAVNGSWSVTLRREQ